MSSYVCNDQTINKIVSGLQVANKAGVLQEALQFEDPREFGTVLYSMNVNAVEQRYPDCISNPDNLPAQNDSDGHHKPYTYSAAEVKTVREFSDALREYLYQCSEGDVSQLPLFIALDSFYETLKSAVEQEYKRAEIEHQKERAQTEYIGATETAKLIRAQLAKKFPGVKFYVKTDKYSGGASVDIVWVDGPASEAVKAITNAFSGAGFDGMNDYKTSNDAWMLPDGSVIFAELESAMGENHITAKPHHEAKRVHFCADCVFETRHYSPEFAKPIIKAVCAEFGKPEPKYYENHLGASYKIIVLDWDSLDSAWGDLAHHINQEIRERLNGKQPEQKNEVTAKEENTTEHKLARTSSSPYGMKF